jgi:hypothetical protein
MVCICILLCLIRKRVRSFTESPAEFREIAGNTVKVAGLGIGIVSIGSFIGFLLFSLLAFAVFGTIALSIGVIQGLSCF